MSATLKQLSELKQICTEQKKKAQNIQTEIGFSLLSQSDSSVLADDLNRYNASLEKSKENDSLAQKAKEKSLEIENMQEKISLVKKEVEDLQNKIFEDMDTDETIELFLKEFADLNKKYPAKAFYVWHNRLTGSCEMGRKSFVKNGGYDLENDTFTVQEFIDITKNDFGGDVIKQLGDRIRSDTE